MVCRSCWLSLMFFCLCEVLTEFDVLLFVWGVDWVLCSFVCVRCWLSLMLIGFSELLIEFDVHLFEWGVFWVWCSFFWVRCLLRYCSRFIGGVTCGWDCLALVRWWLSLIIFCLSDVLNELDVYCSEWIVNCVWFLWVSVKCLPC